jgi:cytochrome bd ubiquinol oxidase subunit II
MFRRAVPLGAMTLVTVAVVSVWTPFLDAALWERWLSWPNLLFFAPLPVLMIVVAFVFFQSLAAARQTLPFVTASLIFLIAYCGVAVSAYPFIVPRAVTVWDAAAPDESLGFLLVGAAILLPLILGYTAYSYWVFRGKVDHSAAYHH